MCCAVERAGEYFSSKLVKGVHFSKETSSQYRTYHINNKRDKREIGISVHGTLSEKELASHKKYIDGAIAWLTFLNSLFQASKLNEFPLAD